MSFFLSSSFILLLLRLTSCMILLFHPTDKFSKCQLFIIQTLFPFLSCRSSRTHDFCFVVHVCLTDITKFLDPGRKCQTLDSGFWNLGTGLWTLHSGSWALDFGIWELDSGRCTLEAGLWTLDLGLGLELLEPRLSTE